MLDKYKLLNMSSSENKDIIIIIIIENAHIKLLNHVVCFVQILYTNVF